MYAGGELYWGEDDGKPTDSTGVLREWKPSRWDSCEDENKCCESLWRWNQVWDCRGKGKIVRDSHGNETAFYCNGARCQCQQYFASAAMEYQSKTYFISHSYDNKKSSTGFDIQELSLILSIKCGLMSGVIEWGWIELFTGMDGDGDELLWGQVGMGMNFRADRWRCG